MTIAGKKILLVEDDDEQRELMRIALERRGYFVVTAQDGLRGFEEALLVAPDLIVTDITRHGWNCSHPYPGYHGFRVRERIVLACAGRNSL